jgi:hypothetical protein
MPSEPTRSTNTQSHSKLRSLRHHPMLRWIDAKFVHRPRIYLVQSILAGVVLVGHPHYRRRSHQRSSCRRCRKFSSDKFSDLHSLGSSHHLCRSFRAVSPPSQPDLTRKRLREIQEFQRSRFVFTFSRSYEPP